MYLALLSAWIIKQHLFSFPQGQPLQLALPNLVPPRASGHRAQPCCVHFSLLPNIPLWKCTNSRAFPLLLVGTWAVSSVWLAHLAHTCWRLKWEASCGVQVETCSGITPSLWGVRSYDFQNVPRLVSKTSKLAQVLESRVPITLHGFCHGWLTLRAGSGAAVCLWPVASWLAERRLLFTYSVSLGTFPSCLSLFPHCSFLSLT